MHKALLVAVAGAGLVLGAAAWADDPTQEEAAAIAAELAKVGCTAEEIEKEAPGRFEIDDAQCEIGQYDFKLNGDYKIILMSRDE